MSEREIIKIAVSGEAKSAIEAAGQRYGMSQIELASRMYTWFAEQDEVVQTAILGLLPAELAPDVARLALQRIAANSGAGSSNDAGVSRPRKAAKTPREAIHVTPKPSEEASTRRSGADSAGGSLSGGGPASESAGGKRPRKSGRRSK